MEPWLSIAWIALAWAASPCHRGTKSIREAVVTSGLLRNRMMSPFDAAIHTSPSTARARTLFGGSALARYAAPTPHFVPSFDSCFQSCPDSASSTYRLLAKTDSAVGVFHLSLSAGVISRT